MSSNFLIPELAAEVVFRNVDGIQLILEEKASSNLSNANIINFALRSGRHFNVNLTCLTLVCTILLTWIVSGPAISLTVSACILILQCKSFIACVKQDTLLVVESVGVHIESKRGFGIFTSTEFLPWGIVEDVFINEVIKGQRVLYCLTFIVKESVGRQGSRRLVPLFQDLLPERKMPGIHVRTLSQLDWLNQEKESLLTIPGSYWLCHRKNIYKFIFRYHRTVRTTTQFSYGRELLKIIRRIIKCHPTQGQQFGTQHLLVTYNCTSWTRQDKMFAIMKFQQRTNAAAFSHAFVLTIRTFPSSEHSLFNLRYPIVKEAAAGTTFKDMNTSLETNEKIISTVISASDKASPRETVMCQTKQIDQISRYNAIDILNEALKTPINSNFQIDDIKNSAIFHQKDEKIGSSTTTGEMHFDKHSTEFYSNTKESISINYNTEKCEEDIEQRSIDYVQEQSLRAKKTEKIGIEKTHGIQEKETKLVVMQKQNQQDVQKYKISSSAEIRKDSINDWLLSDKLNFDNKKSIEENDICTIDNSLDNDKEMTSENIINPSNVPIYQYFIEKKIEDAKPNFIMDQPVPKNQQTEIKDINKRCVSKMIKGNNKSVHTKQKEIYNGMTNQEFQENDGQHTRILMNIDDKQSEDNTHNKSYKARKQKSRESEKKSIPEKILRSSNITDLVMEGLMFTIRQDQDSVAVIEQKTKLEVDEVLENSEKVETKAGEKCLLNSSLLRLENLVTMIDSPRSRDEQHKNRHAISNGANLSPFALSSDLVHDVNINYTDAGMDKSSVFNYNKHNAMNHLDLYQSQWQHQCVSNIKRNNDSCLAGISIEKREQLMDWQDDELEKKYKSNPGMRKREEGIIPEISSSKKINAEPRDINSQTITNIEEIDEHDKSMEGSDFSLNSRAPMKTISAISQEFSSIKLSQQEANVPRIVSDETVTIEQMPSALQKVLRHTRKFSSTTSEMLQQKVQHVARDTISEVDISLEDKCIDSNIANSSLPIKFTVNSETIKSGNEKCRVTIDKDVPETNNRTRVKNSKGKNETRRTLRRSSSSKNSSLRKLQDITEEFYYDLLHVHNKDNAIRQRCLRQKQRSLNNLDDIKSGDKVRIEMLKFIQDITEGARVVVRRLNIDNKSNLLKKNSNLI